MQLRQHKAVERSVHALVLGVLVGAAGMLAVAAAAQWEQLFGLRWLFAVRGAARAPDSVVVVALDEKSAADLGLPGNPRAWPRTLHAQLTRYLAESGARVVAFDLTFDSPGARPEHDAEFAEAIRSAGNVLLAESLRRDTIALDASDGRRVGHAVIETRNAPLRPLAEAALGSAPFMLPKDARVDLYWTFLDEAQTTPTLPVLAYRSFSARLPRTAPGAVGASSDDQPIAIVAEPGAIASIQFLNFY